MDSSDVKNRVVAKVSPTGSDEERVADINATAGRSVPFGINLEQALEAFNLENDEIQRRREIAAAEEEQFVRRKRGFDTFLHLGGFAETTDKIGYMANYVQQDSYYLALGGSITTPGDFYVNPCNTWNQLEDMMEELQKEYKEMDEDVGQIGIPWRGHLVPGMMIAARSKTGPTPEFHRAKILRRKGEDEYEVRLLDYGYVVVVPFKDIRYIRVKRLEKMKMQAIHCTVRYKNVDSPWTEEEGKLFRKMIFDKQMMIHFKRKYRVEEEPIWEVAVHLFCDRTREITQFHVERQVFAKTGRKLTRREEKHSDTKTFVIPTSFEYM